MRSIKIKCRIKDLTNNRDLGVHEIITLQAQNKDDSFLYQKSKVDGEYVTVPNYGQAAYNCGHLKSTLFTSYFENVPSDQTYGTESALPELGVSDSLFLPKGVSLEFTILGNTHGGTLRLTANSSGSATLTIWKNGSQISPYGYDVYSLSGWGTQWGIYRLSFSGGMLPWPSVENDSITLGRFEGWVRYQLLPTRNDLYLINYSAEGNTNNFSSWKTAWQEGFGDYEPEVLDDDNPYDELANDENSGGQNTNFSDDSDTVTEDSLPTINVMGTGFATIFTPSKTQLRALSELFWDSNFFTFMQNLVENIEGMFTSLAMVPFTVTAGSTVEVTWFGFAATGIYLTLASEQYYEFDMGSIDLSGDSRIFKYDNCLDYSPFSKLGIYLPFIGFQDLDIDECRNATIHLKYRIDILSGACVALIKINGSTLYQFSGNCLTQIPITSESMGKAISDVVNVGIAAASARVAGAASAADAAAAESSDKMSQAQKEAHRMHARVSQTNADNHLRSASANATMGLKPQFNKTGSVSSSVSMLSVKQPYLFLTTSRLAIPHSYQHYAGFPCNMTGKLNTFSGYTVVESIRLNDLVATTPEVEEIYQLLKEGVII